MRDISQKTLIDKFVTYIAITRRREFDQLVLKQQALLDALPSDEGQLKQIARLLKEHAPLTEQEESNYRAGLCHGFSIMHAYMSARGKLASWRNTLKILSEWDGMESSLSQQITTEFLQHETYDRLFQQRINDILFSQQGSITDVAQTNFLTPMGLFRSEHDESIKEASYAVAAGYFSREHLKTLLNTVTFSSQAICLIRSVRHTCSIRYDNYQEQWFFYDPNDPEGETACADQSLLIRKIETTLGHSLCLEVASWLDTEQEEIRLLAENAKVLYTEHPSDIVQEFGLYLLAEKNPLQFAEILEKAKQDENLCFAIAEALVYGQYECKGLETRLFLALENNFPLQYQQIRQLAESSEAVSQALYFNRLYKVSSLHRQVYRDFVIDSELPAPRAFELVQSLSEETLKVLQFFDAEANNKRDFLMHFIKLRSFSSDQLMEEMMMPNALITPDFVRAMLIAIDENEVVTSKDKKELLGKLGESILHHDSSLVHFELLQKKIAILERIEAYINSRLKESIVGIVKEVKTTGVGFFGTSANKEVVEKKVAAANKLKMAVLLSPNMIDMLTVIKKSEDDNKKISRWFYREGSYGACLCDCKALLIRQMKPAAPVSLVPGHGHSH